MEGWGALPLSDHQSVLACWEKVRDEMRPGSDVNHPCIIPSFGFFKIKLKPKKEGNVVSLFQ